MHLAWKMGPVTKSRLHTGSHRNKYNLWDHCILSTEQKNVLNPYLMNRLVDRRHHNVSEDAPPCSDRSQTLHLLPLQRFFKKGRYCERNFRWLWSLVLHFQIGELKQFTTSDQRKGQRLEVKLFDDSVSSFPLVWCVIWKSWMNFWLLFFHTFSSILLAIWITAVYLRVNLKRTLGSWNLNLLNSMCVWFSPSNSPTSVSVTAGTEKPFSLCKLWYPKRLVGNSRCSFSATQQKHLYLTVIPACHVPLPHWTERKHATYVRDVTVFMFEMAFCCFNFYSSLKVLFIADAKISFDSFRDGMTATVNSKTIITVNPGKISQQRKHKASGVTVRAYTPKQGSQPWWRVLGERKRKNIIFPQTPERPVCCSAMRRKYPSLVLWMKMRSQKTCQVGYSEDFYQLMFWSPCIYLFICMRVTRITQKVLNRIAWSLVGW